MSSESDEEIVLGCLQLVLSSPKSQHKRVLIPNNGFHELRDQTSLIGWSIWQDGRTERSRFMTSPTSKTTSTNQEYSVFSISPFWKEFNVMPQWYQNIGYQIIRVIVQIKVRAWMGTKSSDWLQSADAGAGAQLPSETRGQGLYQRHNATTDVIIWHVTANSRLSTMFIFPSHTKQFKIDRGR